MQEREDEERGDLRSRDSDVDPQLQRQKGRIFQEEQGADKV
jgi:hypothetical protein